MDTVVTSPDPAYPMTIRLRNAPLAALWAWLIPGAGHLYQRRYAKGLLFMVCILGTYFFGLAIGDALGCAVQHRKPGTFTPLGDLIGGGPFDLPRGAWSDDTSMALCLAESLLESGGSNPADQVRRYQLWQREGHLTSTGQCVGITAAVSRALATAQFSGKPHAGSHDPARVDKEPLSRVIAAVLFHFADPQHAIEQAAECAGGRRRLECDGQVWQP